MPVAETQLTLLNAVTTKGPSDAPDLTLTPLQWFVFTIHANNAQVQIEYSFDGLAFYPALAVGGTVNPAQVVQGSTQVFCQGPLRFIRANVLQLQSGSVTCILQGYPWDFPAHNTTIQGQVGLAAYGTANAPGATMVPRFDSQGGLFVSLTGGEYAEMVATGQVFIAALQGTQALSVNSTTATGIILTNPEGSGINAEILEVQVALASLPSGESALILTGQPTRATGAAPVSHTTALPVHNALLGSRAVGYCKADSAATLPAALIHYTLGAGVAASVAASTAFPPFVQARIGGLVTLGPGTCTSLQALTTAITVVGHIAWRERPLASSDSGMGPGRL